MNTKYPQAPEVVAAVRSVVSSDDSSFLCTVCGVQVMKSEKSNQSATLQIDLRNLDIRQLKRIENLIIEIDLADAVAAISLATLNAE